MRWASAEKLVDVLRAAANSADKNALAGDLAVMRGERWSCRVESYDGFVAVRFFSPGPGHPDRVPLTADAARRLADRVEFKKQQAAYRMRFVFTSDHPYS